MKKSSVFILVAMLMGLAGVQQAEAVPGDLLGDVSQAFVYTPNTSDDPDGSGGQFQHQAPGAGLWPDDWDGGGADGRDRGVNFGGTAGVQELPYVVPGGTHSGKNWVNVGLGGPAPAVHYILSWFGGGSAANLAVLPYPPPDPLSVPASGVPYLRSQMELEVRLLSGLGADVSLRSAAGTIESYLNGHIISPDMAGINDRVTFSQEGWNEWFQLDLRGVTGDSGAVVALSWTQVEVPEPVTMSLLGLGSLVVLRRRRRA